MNKEIYENNLKAYEEIYGEYIKIENNKYTEKLEDCKNGCKTLKIEFEGKKLYLNSKYDPIKEAKKEYANINFEYGTIVFVFGFGLSYYIQALIDKLKDRASIIVYERDKELFDIVMKNIDITKIIKNKNIKITFDINYLEDISAITYYKILYIPVYRDLYLEECKKFAQNTKKFIENIFYNSGTINRFKFEWPKVTFSNLPYIFNSYKMYDFKDIFKDKPIIVVGAGPSLNKNVHILKEIQDKICIISAFSVAKVLQKNNIKPHFLTTIDSLQYGIEEFEANIPLIFISLANTQLLEKHKANKILCITDEEFLLKDLLKDNFYSDNVVNGATTVTLFSALVAKYLGSNRIILMGQDFCWTKEKTHADGSVHIQKKEQHKYYFHYEDEVIDMYGNVAYTNKAFRKYKEGFDSFAKYFLEEIDVIQASEGGLEIENAKTMKLNDVINKYCKDNFYDVNYIIKSNFEKNNILVPIEKQDKTLLKVKDTYKNLKEMKKLSKEALDLSQDLIDNIKKNCDLQENNKIINRLDEIDLKLKDNFVVKYLLFSYLPDIESYSMLDEESENENINLAMINKNLYEQLNKALISLVDIVKQEMKYKD